MPFDDHIKPKLKPNLVFLFRSRSPCSFVVIGDVGGPVVFAGTVDVCCDGGVASVCIFLSHGVGSGATATSRSRRRRLVVDVSLCHHHLVCTVLNALVVDTGSGGGGSSCGGTGSSGGAGGLTINIQFCEYISEQKASRNGVICIYS